MVNLFTGSTALITGASRGIGAAFAKALAARGANLILVARDERRLAELASRARRYGVRADIVPADLGDADGPGQVQRQVERAGLTVDHLVNNAGIAEHGQFTGDVPVAAHLRVIDVNVRAVIELAGRFLPGMLVRRRGGLLNVASTAAFQGLAYLSVYSGSKAFLLNWNEAVWLELRGTGVRSCCLLPGPVDTEFFEANRLRVRPPRQFMQSPAQVAEAGLRGYGKDKSHVVSGVVNRMGAWATRFAPRSFVVRVAEGYAKPK